MRKLIPPPSPITGRHSLRALLRDGMAQLEASRVPSAPLAAELLLMHTLGRDRAWVYAHPEQELERADCDAYFSLIARRASGVPTQYLTGHQEFWGLDFEVTPDVLIPRPETEHVIEVALERLVEQASAGGISLSRDQPAARAILRDKAFRIADVGTGSGCIAVALAHELPAAKIVATDISAAALDVARRNAVRHSVAARVDFLESNLLDFAARGLRAESCTFDLIASNPPYISRREFPTLQREVREHEPAAALLAGETGTEIYAPLIAQAAALLKPGGILVLELGHDSSGEVGRLLQAPGWENVSVRNDLAGIPRVASAQRLT